MFMARVAGSSLLTASTTIFAKNSFSPLTCRIFNVLSVPTIIPATITHSQVTCMTAPTLLTASIAISAENSFSPLTCGASLLRSVSLPLYMHYRDDDDSLFS